MSKQHNLVEVLQEHIMEEKGSPLMFQKQDKYILYKQIYEKALGALYSLQLSENKSHNKKVSKVEPLHISKSVVAAEEEVISFWRNYLEGYTEKTSIPKDQDRQQEEREGKKYIADLDHVTTRKVEEFCKNLNISQEGLFYTAWAILLQRHAGKKDIVLGTTTAGSANKMEDIEDVIELCMTILPLRVQLKEEESIFQLLYNVEENLKERKRFRHISLEEVKDRSAFQGEAHLFDSVLIVENFPLEKIFDAESSLLKVQSNEIFHQMNYDLAVQIINFTKLQFKFIYDGALFKEAAVRKLAAEYIALIKAMLLKPAVSLQEIE